LDIVRGQLIFISQCTKGKISGLVRINNLRKRISTQDEDDVKKTAVSQDSVLSTLSISNNSFLSVITFNVYLSDAL
jgi:hypothetical protein